MRKDLELTVKVNTRVGGPWRASDGWVTEYIDMLGAFQSAPLSWKRYFFDRLSQVDHIVVAGRSGAFLAGFLATSKMATILNPGKTHGLPWNGLLPPKGTRVALVDDICVTGATLKYLRDWCEKAELVVVREVVGWPYLEVDETVAKRLNEVRDATTSGGAPTT